MISIVDTARSLVFRRARHTSILPSLTQLHRVIGKRGLFTGQTIEWSGRTYYGKSGLLRFWVEELLQQEIGVSWIDSGLTLEAEGFVDIKSEKFWMLRPSSVMDALNCADLLIRSGCFSVVILEVDSRQKLRVIRRLQQLAKQNDVLLIWVHNNAQHSLDGVVAHRIQMRDRIVRRKTNLSRWRSIQIDLSLSNLKDPQGSISSHIHLHERTKSPESGCKENSDRGGHGNHEHIQPRMKLGR